MQVDTDTPKTKTRADDAPVTTDGFFGGRSQQSSGWSLGSVVRTFLAVSGLILGTWLLWEFSVLVLYLIIGVLLAYVISPLVDRIQGGVGGPRWLSILLAFGAVFGTIGLVLTYLVPFLVTQATELSQQVSQDTVIEIASYLQARVDATFPGAQVDLIEAITQAFETLFERDTVAAFLGSVVDVFANIVYALAIIPMVTFFALKDGNDIRRSMLEMVPNRYFEVSLQIIEKVERNLGTYFRALLTQCTFVGLTATIFLYFVGLDYALAVGAFTGFANTIPYFGPAMGFLLGSVVAVMQTGDFTLVFWVFVAMGATQLMDNIFFQPIIFSRAAQTHPLVILFVVLIFAQLGGIIGMIIAIPLVTTVRVIIQEVLWSLRTYRILEAS